MKALTLLPVLALSACATSHPAPATTGSPTAGFGQTANVAALQVTPIALVEDSRCPINARCVWAGRLTIKVRVLTRGGAEQVEGPITMGQPMPIGGGNLSLVAASPDKMAGQPSNPSDYRFTFEMSAAN